MDAETGEALKDTAGKEITAAAKFTPKASSGKQKVKFKFDATLLGGHKAVVLRAPAWTARSRPRMNTPRTRTRRSSSCPSRSARPLPMRPTGTRRSASARP